MKPNGPFSNRAAARPGRGHACRAPILRGVILIGIAGASTGCAYDVMLQNPQAGTTEVCRESLGGLNPWSQTTGCVAEHVAQGWTRAGQD